MEWSGFLVIAACLGGGILVSRAPGLPADGHRALNSFVLYVPLPALILHNMHALLRSAENLRTAWVPASMAWIQFALAALLVWLVRKPLRLERASQGALLLTAGLGNTAFIGFPLIEALRGKEALPAAVAADQPGSFLVFSSLGVWAAATFSSGSPSWRGTLRKAFTFPPTIAFLLSVALVPFAFPSTVERALERISASLVPAALVSVGMQLRFDKEALRHKWKPLTAGLLFKLGLSPALMAGLYFGVLNQQGLGTEVAVLQAGMAPMITAAVLAQESKLDSELAAIMVGLGIPLSLLTVPLWAWVL